MANNTKARTTAIPHGLTRDQLLEMYRLVRLTRSLEERLELLFKQSKVIGGLFRSLGQEGESVASAYALRRRTDGTGDMLSPLIRNLGSMLTIGAKPVEVVKQYMAKGDSLARGKELNIHITDFDRGFIGQISPLGDLIPVMAGVALTFKQRGEDRVAMVYIGDGATSTGAFHEGVNFAAVQKLPLVVIVENNRWAYSTPAKFMTAAKAFVDKAPGYGMAGEQVDGNDMLAVYGARQGRRGRHADRGDDVPPQGPRAARCADLRGPGRDRALGQHQRPHRPLRQGAAGQRLGHRAGADGHRRADRPRAGRGGGRSREEPAS
jgi:pyruvate dehydrogenase E1 component alpha subunit/2-oxoisovalerate dehydrogenase E1 component alpha subunit